MAGKSEVYTWRVSPAMKASLEEAARSASRSVARLLDEIVAERLQAIGLESEAEQEVQRRLHAKAAEFAGALAGAGPARGETVNARLRRAGDRPRAR